MSLTEMSLDERTLLLQSTAVQLAICHEEIHKHNITHFIDLRVIDKMGRVFRYFENQCGA